MNHGVFDGSCDVTGIYTKQTPPRREKTWQCKCLIHSLVDGTDRWRRRVSTRTTVAPVVTDLWVLDLTTDGVEDRATSGDRGTICRRGMWCGYGLNRMGLPVELVRGEISTGTRLWPLVELLFVVVA